MCVLRTGVEPARLTAREFRSLMSTYSIIWVNGLSILTNQQAWNMIMNKSMISLTRFFYF